MFNADLEAAAKLDVDTEDAPVKKALTDYLDAQRIILKQVRVLKLHRLYFCHLHFKPLGLSAAGTS